MKIILSFVSLQEVHFQVDRCSFVSPMARVIFGFRALDIFPYIVNRTSGKIRDVEMKCYYNVSDFFPFKRCAFMNIPTWCPQNIRAVLESAYTDLGMEYICKEGEWVYKGSYFKKTLEVLQSILDFFSR